MNHTKWNEITILKTYNIVSKVYIHKKIVFSNKQGHVKNVFNYVYLCRQFLIITVNNITYIPLTQR